MGLLNELDNIKYYPVVDLIQNEEAYDKKRNILTAEEVFKLCQNRYELVEKMLLPLKKKLGENIEIIDIGFANGMQDDISIFVRYNKDDKQNLFTICNYDGEIYISANDDRLEKYSFVMINRKIILDIFNQIYDESLNTDISINSTSKKFVVKDNFRIFTIKDINEKTFSIEALHSLYAKSGLLYNKEKINSSFPKLKELFTDENILNIYHHMHIYEEELPKVLKKN